MPEKDKEKTPRTIVYQARPTTERHLIGSSEESYARLKVLVTLNRPRGQVKGTDVPPLYLEIKANAAMQYVLREDAQEWDLQYAAMEHYAKKYNLTKLGEEKEGVSPIVTRKDDSIAEVNAENASLRKSLADSEAKLARNNDAALKAKLEKQGAEIEALKAKLAAKK